MARRDPREARALGLWSASWLAVLLVAGLVRLGDLTVQWPVLIVPVLWALVALRPRSQRPGSPNVGRPAALGDRTDTVERPAVRPHRPERDG
jgi:hypothetical protein